MLSSSELMSAHELEKKELEESFEKLRLSLQVSISLFPLTNRCLAPAPQWVLYKVLNLEAKNALPILKRLNS